MLPLLEGGLDRWWLEHGHRIDRHTHIPDCHRILQKRGEGIIIIDPGSYDNLVGSGWSRRQDALARAAGQKASQYTPCDLDVGGVGTGVVHSHRQVTHQISCPMLCGAVCEGTFTASEIESDVVPALIGLRALTKMRCILDFACIQSSHRSWTWSG